LYLLLNPKKRIAMKNILLAATALMTFSLTSCCDCDKESKGEAVDTASGSANKIVLEKKQFKSKDSWTIKMAEVAPYREAFNEQIKDERFKRTYLLTKDALLRLAADSDVVGVRMIPVMYTETVERDDQRFEKGQIGFVFVPEKKDMLDTANMWDYNKPCPPNTCIDILQYKPKTK
jgi:hypothetical protein